LCANPPFRYRRSRWQKATRQSPTCVMSFQCGAMVRSRCQPQADGTAELEVLFRGYFRGAPDALVRDNVVTSGRGVNGFLSQYGVFGPSFPESRSTIDAPKSPNQSTSWVAISTGLDSARPAIRRPSAALRAGSSPADGSSRT